MAEAERDAGVPTLRSWNIDGVIPREAWEDRGRDGGLGARLETLERRLHAAVDRVEDIPVALERRVDAMEAELRARSEELESLVGALERLVGAELAGRMSELAGGLATFEHRVAAMTAQVGELGELLVQVREGAAADRAEQRAAVRSVEARLVAAVTAACDELVRDAADTLAAARAAGSHLDRLADRLVDVDGALTVHRYELDEVLHRERRALTDALATRVLSGLRPRDRRRVAERLVEGGFSDADELPPDEGRAQGDGVRARQQLRALVIGVPGVGPARADALVTAFGSVERLGVADVVEVVAFAGLPHELAARVLDVARRTPHR